MNVGDILGGFTVHATDMAATQGAIDAFKKRYGSSFTEYLHLCTEATSIELAHSSGGYLRVWDPLYAVETDKDYGISEYLPGAVPIGDDGNTRVLFYWGGPQGNGLYLCDMGALIPEEVRYVSRSLTSLLSAGEGASELLLGN